MGHPRNHSSCFPFCPQDWVVLSWLYNYKEFTVSNLGRIWKVSGFQFTLFWDSFTFRHHTFWGHSEVSPSVVVERDWLLRRREGLKRVRSLKLQLFCTLTGLEPSALISAPGERRSVTDVCLLLTLWPRGLAILTRSLKLSFWLRDQRQRDIKNKYLGADEIPFYIL